MSRVVSRIAVFSAVLVLTAALPAAAQAPAADGKPKAAASKTAPKPAPKTASKTASSQAAKPTPPTSVAQRAAPPMQAEPPQIKPNPFAALFGKTGEGAAMTPEQRALIDKINAYMSSMQVLNGNFIQVGPDGRKSQGTFYIQKPGKVRFEYDAPSPMELIADGETVVVRDRNLATQDIYPLSQTPLRFLLAERVNLLRDTDLKAVYADDVFITAVVEEKNGLVGTSRLMIMFSAKDMQLKQWTVTDPQGYDTTVAVYNLDTTRRADPSMFRIDYTRNMQ
jgi:outer membrane lipoprotein-sorting protein